MGSWRVRNSGHYQSKSINLSRRMALLDPRLEPLRNLAYHAPLHEHSLRNSLWPALFVMKSYV